MPLSSMTGFARESGSSETFQWVLEIRSVNGKGLDIRSRIPNGFDIIFDELRNLLQRNIARGQCQVSLSISSTHLSPKVTLNIEALSALIQSLESLPLPDHKKNYSLDGLLSVRGIVELDEGSDPQKSAVLISDLKKAAQSLVHSFMQARHDEGKALKHIIEGQVRSLKSLVLQALEHPARQPDAIQKKLSTQISQLLGTETKFDADRLYQEAVIIAARVDIQEEIDRLKAHLESIDTLLQTQQVIGRKLDFLAQECGREANTLCSKANDTSLSRIGLEIKVLVEQLREQVQNVE